MGKVRYVAGTACRVIGGWLAVAALAFSPVPAQEASPKKHDNAEARQLLVQAEQVAAKMTDKQEQIVALENIGTAKALAQDYEGARVIARTLGTDVSKEKILRDIAITQALAGDTEEGLKTVGGIKAAEGKMMTCFMMALELARVERRKEAVHVLDQAADTILPKIASETEQLSAIVLLAEGYAMAGEPETTSRLASVLKDQPRLAEIMNALLAVAKAYNHDLTGAKQKLALLHVGDTQTMALTAIATVQEKMGDKQGAADSWKQLVEIAQAKPLKPSRILGLLLDQQATGDLDATRATIETAYKITPPEDEETLSQIAQTQANIGDVDLSLKTLMQLKNVNKQSNVRYAIAFARAQTGDVAGALALAPPDADGWCQTQVLIGTARGILHALNSYVKP